MMGWKTFKDTFCIERHTVSATSKGICIGSDYLQDLVTVDRETGELQERREFIGFLDSEYPGLRNASKEELLAAIRAEDTFSTSIPVFTHLEGRIIEESCEVPGFPNVTHEGNVMHEGSYSIDKSQVVRWAKRHASTQAKYFQQRIKEIDKPGFKIRLKLKKAREWQARLDADYPDVSLGK